MYNVFLSKKFGERVICFLPRNLQQDQTSLQRLFPCQARSRALSLDRREIPWEPPSRQAPEYAAAWCANSQSRPIAHADKCGRLPFRVVVAVTGILHDESRRLGKIVAAVFRRTVRAEFSSHSCTGAPALERIASRIYTQFCGIFKDKGKSPREIPICRLPAGTVDNGKCVIAAL